MAQDTNGGNPGATGVVGSPSDVMRYMDTRKTGRAKSQRSSGSGGGGNNAGRALFRKTLRSGRK